MSVISGTKVLFTQKEYWAMRSMSQERLMDIVEYINQLLHIDNTSDLEF